MIVIDIKGDTSLCAPDCNELIKSWQSWVTGTTNFGRITIDGNYVSHELSPAMIHIPETIEGYRKMIGDKSRNMISKSVRHGYSAQVINYNDFISDIHAVNTSKAERQGRLMAENYRIMPKPIMRHGEYCCTHDKKFYGVIKEGRLYAWANIAIVNELVVVNQILGHGAHLSYGIMNALVDYIVRDCITNYPNAKFVNYLTLTGCLPGLALFKKSMGFVPTVCKFINHK